MIIWGRCPAEVVFRHEIAQWNVLGRGTKRELSHKIQYISNFSLVWTLLQLISLKMKASFYMLPFICFFYILCKFARLLYLGLTLSIVTNRLFNLFPFPHSCRWSCPACCSFSFPKGKIKLLLIIASVLWIYLFIHIRVCDANEEGWAVCVYGFYLHNYW